jgi:hypothetical protein
MIKSNIYWAMFWQRGQSGKVTLFKFGVRYNYVGHYWHLM